MLLQVLRVRDAPAAPARARRGRARCSTAPRAAASRSCSSSPARRPTITRACASGSPSSGFEDFTAYVVWACERALERGLLPHTNLGVLSRDDLARLREVTASQGLMLESVNPDLVAHQGSPTKHPELRLETIRAAGELQIPFTSGILVGIGESEDDRIAALRGAGRGARRARPPAGGDPAELRPAPPLLRRGAGRDRHRGGRALLAHGPVATRRTATCPSGRRRSRSRT